MSKRSRWKKQRRLEDAQKLGGGEGQTREAHSQQAREGRKSHHPEHQPHKPRYTGLKGIYVHKYKTLLLIPFIILLLAFVQIGVQTANTGSFLHKGVSLKGGITVTLASEGAVAAEVGQLLNTLSSNFPEVDFGVKKLKISGEDAGIIVEADIMEDEQEKLESFLRLLEAELSTERADFTIEIMGSSLGASFFRETFTAVLIAFLFMGIVVFIYFRTFVPSIAVILAAFSDIVITLAITNILGIKLSTAGIAAFLMLIGYSVDTDILLSTHILKKREGSVDQRIFTAMKTGLFMTITTLSAVTVALIVSESEVITQIMTILLIGLLVDVMNTWIQNVGILKLYLERKKQ